jgi:predicted house-cleaning noncanonical NTP pyrophosphatase (MazG superfamily)
LRTVYDKLIRDHIPAIIERNGGSCGIETLSETAYRAALRQKLIEEAQEVAAVAEGDTNAFVTELADLHEVIDALTQAFGITSETVHMVQRQRREERGGFTQRRRLLWTEE